MLGMLWQDSSDDSLPDKIKRVKEYYTNKYGIPTFCHVSDQVLTAETVIYDLRIIPDKTLFYIGYFWIGNENVTTINKCNN